MFFMGIEYLFSNEGRCVHAVGIAFFLIIHIDLECGGQKGPSLSSFLHVQYLEL